MVNMPGSRRLTGVAEDVKTIHHTPVTDCFNSGNQSCGDRPDLCHVIVTPSAGCHLSWLYLLPRVTVSAALY